jgi:predicted MPP superfamily phosphohydrolase
MIRRMASWPDRVRTYIGHSLSEPFYRFFRLFPHWEIGLDHPEITRLSQVHEALAGRRAIHLSDLHVDRHQPRHDKIIHAVHDLRPDWIFITGDLLNVPEGVPPLFQFLAHLREIAPVFITLGNHDHYSGVPLSEYAELADRHKITLLMNQSTFVRVGSGELAIVGVDDPSLHRADLILCGHSHGGQWQIPGIPTFWLPPGCRGRIAGPHRNARHRLYVNRGLGWSFLPFRWNCRPEITLLTWTNTQGQAA